jgi:predicted DNA-binding transcriptional regulator YafY
MAYERAADVVRLALRLQGTWRGLTLDDIQRDFEVARRTAERLRNAVEDVFGPLELVDTGERRHHWRLSTATLRSLVTVSAEELAELNAAAAALDRAGLAERAAMVRELVDKLRALLAQDAINRIEPDLQALMVAEGLAMRPGPRPRMDPGLLGLLRDAIKSSSVVAFDYRAQATGKVTRREVQPYGIIYGNRAFLVGHTDRGPDLHLWRLANISDARITGAPFARNPAFNLQDFAKRSFGTFQEDPSAVQLRFAAEVADDVGHFIFHPDQTVAANPDGSLTVRFTAGGLDEICWHLVTWGTHVTIDHPTHLRQRMATLCTTLATHHTSFAETGNS